MARDDMLRDRVDETIRDDLDEPDRQHLDEQTASGLPAGGPGRSKMENLRRIRRQRETQRRRLREADPEARV